MSLLGLYLFLRPFSHRGLIYRRPVDQNLVQCRFPIAIVGIDEHVFASRLPGPISWPIRSKLATLTPNRSMGSTTSIILHE